MNTQLAVLIDRWKADPHSTYNTWFLWEQRLKNSDLGTEIGARAVMFLVAPDDRRGDVQQQLRRPAFSRVAELGLRYLQRASKPPRVDRRFGAGLKPLLEISTCL